MSDKIDIEESLKEIESLVSDLWDELEARSTRELYPGVSVSSEKFLQLKSKMEELGLISESD